MSKCPHCGAEFAFDAGKQVVHCEYCGSDFVPEELNSTEKFAKKEEFQGKSYSCTQCGATLLTFDETAITFCSYCGSQGMIEEKMMVQNNPDFIIPFQKTQEECIKNYKKKISSFLFAPSYMKNDVVVNKFRGIYMPYAVYKLVHQGDCQNKGSKYNHRSGDYVYYDDYTIHADVDSSYDGISFDLLSNFYDEYSMSIPFNFKEAKEFQTSYLAGFYADTKDVEPGIYSSQAISIASNDSTRFLKKAREFQRYGCANPRVIYRVGEKKMGMFPVYFLAVRDKKNENIHYAVINGQTGKVVADVPISFPKYFISSLLLAIPIFIFMNYSNSFTTIPLTLDWFSIFLTGIAFFMCLTQLRKSRIKEERSNDLGYMSHIKEGEIDEKKKDKKKKKHSFQFKYAWKFLLAFLISLSPIVLKPVSDVPYYIAALTSLVLVLISFYDQIKIHNELVSRKIPQLEKRGGDEHE